MLKFNFQIFYSIHVEYVKVEASSDISLKL